MNFFDDADKKARMNRVRKNVDEIMNQRNFMLNERRAKYAFVKKSNRIFFLINKYFLNED